MNSRPSQARVLVGDCRELMRSMGDASVDAIVTDPPYELGFMGKKWDASGIAYDLEVWREALRVLKPGGHLLAFGGTRTYHRMACAIEDAGFEVRDSIHWIYGSGFPKSMNVSKAFDRSAGELLPESTAFTVAGVYNEKMQTTAPSKGYVPPKPATDAAKQWQGWGTALKPAHEPIVVARKPLVGTVAANVLQHGTGAINVDGCRVEPTGESRERIGEPSRERRYTEYGGTNFAALPGVRGGDPSGRWPANIVLGHSPDCDDQCAEDCAVAEMDRQSGTSKSSKSAKPIGKRPRGMGEVGERSGDPSPNGPTYADSGGASRFFPCFRYQAKASKLDRGDGNTHPTVKPVELMRWLVRLVTPPGGLVLDPFAGSGTTGVACVREGFDFVGLELLDNHAQIARRRIEAAQEEVPAQMALDVVGSDNG